MSAAQDYYLVIRTASGRRIARVVEGLRNALDAAFSDYYPSASVLTLKECVALGLDPKRPSSWVRS